MEGDRDRQARENEVGGVVECEADPFAIAERAPDQDTDCPERILADQEHHKARDKERGEQH